MAARAYEVRLTRGAEQDLEAIHGYMSQYRGPDEADRLLDAITGKIASLERFPERGAIPKELEALGIDAFRQMLVLPYRLIYLVKGKAVFVMLIADGRRDMQALLERRLLAK